jgi:hypothetical protein
LGSQSYHAIGINPGRYWETFRADLKAAGMPDLRSALIAFVAEHRRCGDLDGGLEGGIVRIACSCGAEIVRRASPPPAGESTRARSGGSTL